MALPPNFLDELRARTPIAALIGRGVRLVRSGRDVKACCPFHGEKTPSFYVYDDHFHCFGCGEHGDAITFVMKSAGVSFMEAVESLAAEAGLEVPKASPQAAEAEQRRAGIAEVLEAAANVYQKWLYMPEGAAALAYLRNRGLSDETIRKFGLGWSGEGRGALAAALRPQGITTEQLTEAGLMKAGDYGPVDYFFSRVMFPIRDRRGGMISFGGRILGDGQPKYVNGPETPVFSKRRSLYGLNFARDAVRKGAALVVVEGYMDVIALAQAGFGGAVAPLGTALTEDHLAEIWRLSPEPVICFDADAAGRRAALKTVDLALGALAPDRSLKFLRLPEKDDPDSVIRREGQAKFQARLETAQPLSKALYDMLAEGFARTTAEAKASFYNRLMEIAGRISDKALASEYRQELKERFFGERRGARNGGGKLGTTARPFARPRAMPAEQVQPNDRRHFIMTAILLEHPAIFPDIEEAFAGFMLPQSCDRMRSALHDFLNVSQPLDKDRLSTHLSGLGLGKEAMVIEAVAAQDHRSNPDSSPAEAVGSWWHYFNMMDESILMLTQQRDEQLRYFIDHPDDQAACDRLARYSELLWLAKKGEYGGAET